MNLSTLPDDMVYKIALDLKYDEIISLCQTSKHLNETVCKDNHFWYNKLLTDQYISDFYDDNTSYYQIIRMVNAIGKFLGDGMHWIGVEGEAICVILQVDLLPDELTRISEYLSKLSRKKVTHDVIRLSEMGYRFLEEIPSYDADGNDTYVTYEDLSSEDQDYIYYTVIDLSADLSEYLEAEPDMYMESNEVSIRLPPINRFYVPYKMTKS